MTIEDIASAEEQLRQAMLSGDTARLAALIDDDLMFVMADGAVIDKAADLAAHASGLIHLSQLDPSDQRIAVRHGTAVVSVRMATAGVSGGQPFEAAYRYLRFWCETPTGWRVTGGSMASTS